jgi:hypothetical protein
MSLAMQALHRSFDRDFFETRRQRQAKTALPKAYASQ